MIFWILVALTAIIVIGTFAVNVTDPYGGFGFALAASFLALIISAVVGFLTIMFCSLIPTNHDLIRDDTHKLKALGNNTTTTGRFYFLGGGYIDGKRVLNFISEHNGGAIKVEKADAEDATIYEGNDTATVRVRHFDHNNGWVTPWPLGSHTTYEFRIPEGSVVESYTLDNK